MKAVNISALRRQVTTIGLNDIPSALFDKILNNDKATINVVLDYINKFPDPQIIAKTRVDWYSPDNEVVSSNTIVSYYVTLIIDNTTPVNGATGAIVLDAVFHKALLNPFDGTVVTPAFWDSPTVNAPITGQFDFVMMALKKGQDATTLFSGIIVAYDFVKSFDK